MRWKVSFHGTRPTPFSWLDRLTIEGHAAKWSPRRVGRGGEASRPPLSADGRQRGGLPRLTFSTRPEQDFCTLIRALQELAFLFPDLELEVTDDHYLERVHPAAIGDPTEVLEGWPG